MKFFGNSVQTRWIRSLQICGPFLRHREVADVVAHAGGARREDREVGAALALELELRALDRGPDLVVGHLEAGARRQRRLVLDRLGLVLAEAVQVLGLGRVMAVAIDDHGPVACTMIVTGIGLRAASSVRRPCPDATKLRGGWSNQCRAVTQGQARAITSGSKGYGGDSMFSKVAVIQSPPVLLDRAKTIDVALGSIAEAVGARRLAAGLSRGLHPGLPDLDLAAQAGRGRRAHRRDPCAIARQCRRPCARRPASRCRTPRPSTASRWSSGSMNSTASTAAPRCSTPSSSSAPTARC